MTDLGTSPPRPSDERSDVLDAERRHLDRARTALAAMRAETEQQGDVGADQLTSYSLGKLRAERLIALADDPAVASGRALPGTTAPPPLFFGRVDWDPGSGEPPSHIGRRHIRENAGGEPLVIDWRAPVARAFYRATPADRMGVSRRRRFGYARGVLTSCEDEPLDQPQDPAGRGDPTGTVESGASRLLREEIERPRVGPMRDIVATIQPDQDDIVRADLDQSICVQGAPGTGKTAVGLHRAAFLLYTHPERLRRSGVLVVGPNAAFLRYIAAVLPALGEIDVAQVTVEELVGGRVKVRAVDAPDVGRLKGDARLATVLRRALYGRIGRPEEIVVPVGSRRYRIAPERLRRWVDDLIRGDTHYTAARERLRALVAQDVRRQWESRGGAPSDGEMRAVARSAPVRTAVDAMWPAVDPAALVAELLSDPRALQTAARGLLDADECAALCWDRPPRSPRSARWSPADAVLVDEVAALLERTPGFGHVVVDEAQDLSAMQCRAIGRRGHGSFTVLGDLAQATTPWGTTDWASTLEHLGRPDARVEPLTRGYRVPGAVLDLANRLLPHVAAGVEQATSVRPGRDALAVREVGPDVVGAAVAETRAAADLEGSIGVICADATLPAVAAAFTAAGVDHDLLAPADSGGDTAVGSTTGTATGTAAGTTADAAVDAAQASRVQVVAASLAKGLEYDHVILLEPADIAGTGRYGLARLYVALTRAVTRLVILHHAALPTELTG